MNCRGNLINIQNALGTIETKGDSTLILADCRRLLAQTIPEIPDEKPKVKKEDKPEK